MSILSPVPEADRCPKNLPDGGHMMRIGPWADGVPACSYCGAKGKPAVAAIAAVDTLDLSEAADKIRPTNAALADLLEAVEAIDADEVHTVEERPDSEPECTDDCPPCVAMYAARVVAAEYLGGLS